MNTRITRTAPVVRDIPPLVLDVACRAFYDCGRWPGQLSWREMVEKATSPGDLERLALVRFKLQAALSALIDHGLLCHHNARGRWIPTDMGPPEPGKPVAVLGANSPDTGDSCDPSVTCE